MNDQKLRIIKNLLNRHQVVNISQVGNSVILDFHGDVRLFIDSGSSGLDFSLIAMTEAAVDLIESLSEN